MNIFLIVYLRKNLGRWSFRSVSISSIIISVKGPSPTNLRLNRDNKYPVVIAVKIEKKRNTPKSLLLEGLVFSTFTFSEVGSSLKLSSASLVTRKAKNIQSGLATYYQWNAGQWNSWRESAGDANFHVQGEVCNGKSVGCLS